MAKKKTIKRRQKVNADKWVRETERAKEPFDWFMARLIGMQILSNSPPLADPQSRQRLAERMQTLAMFGRLVGAATDDDSLTSTEQDAEWEHWRDEFGHALARMNR